MTIFDIEDEYGEKIDEDSEENNNNKISFESKDPNDFMLNMKSQDLIQKGKQQKKEYTPIKSYKPSGNLVYNDELLSKIEGKFS